MQRQPEKTYSPELASFASGPSLEELENKELMIEYYLDLARKLSNPALGKPNIALAIKWLDRAIAENSIEAKLEKAILCKGENDNKISITLLKEVIASNDKIHAERAAKLLAEIKPSVVDSAMTYFTKPSASAKIVTADQDYSNKIGQAEHNLNSLMSDFSQAPILVKYTLFSKLEKADIEILKCVKHYVQYLKASFMHNSNHLSLILELIKELTKNRGRINIASLTNLHKQLRLIKKYDKKYVVSETPIEVNAMIKNIKLHINRLEGRVKIASTVLSYLAFINKIIQENTWQWQTSFIMNFKGEGISGTLKKISKELDLLFINQPFQMDYAEIAMRAYANILVILAGAQVYHSNRDPKAHTLITTAWVALADVARGHLVPVGESTLGKAFSVPPAAESAAAAVPTTPAASTWWSSIWANQPDEPTAASAAAPASASASAAPRKK